MGGALVAVGALGGSLGVTGTLAKWTSSSPGSGSASAATTTGSSVPLTVTATTPAPGATGVDTGAAITVTFSTALSPESIQPGFTPPIAGAWAPYGSDGLRFVAAQTPIPGTQELLTIPGGPNGMLGADGQRMAHSTIFSFTFAPGSVERLQQLLAETGYLPLTFTPPTTLLPGQETPPQDLADPQAGTFAWRWNIPTLTSLWTEGSENVITKGAVMSFESQHGMTPDGVAGSQVWAALLQAVAAGDSDPQPYSYVYVSTSLPENVTVYQNGNAVYNTLANTGIPAAPTAPGTYPVYLRYTVTTMTGTNPDGSHYSDPGIPWVSYFNGGDALHGFIRSSYGFPQSLGCVEMPISHAASVYPLTPIGTLVTIE